MSLHDEYARLTPFEIAYPDRVRFDALAASVAAEADRRGVDPTILDAFATLEPVGAFLAELHGDDVPRVDLLEHGVVAYHGVHFVRAGCPLFLLDTDASRGLVGEAPRGRAVPPSQAGYLQLPQHLFWTSGAEDAAPESVDGLFWTVTAERRMHVLPVVGLRPDRPGFGALSLPDAPLAHAEQWMHSEVRARGADYSSSLPGADLDALYAFEAAGEVLKLLARFFAYADATPSALETRGPVASNQGSPRPSALPYTRVKRVV
jgi:hypothetical protein